MDPGKQFKQLSIPGVGTESRYKVTPDSPSAELNAQGRAEHDLNYGSPHWTGLAHDPEFERRDTPRPGGQNVPGQMVMGPHDLSDVGRRHIKNPESKKLGELRRTVVTAEAPLNADLEVRPHGGVYDTKVHDRAGVKDIYTAYGPQNSKANQQMWEQHGQFRNVKATTPVHSDQQELRYDPSAEKSPLKEGGTKDNPIQIRGPISPTGTGTGGSGDNGLPKIVKKNETLFQVDGHHRMHEMRNRGMEELPIHFLDLDKHPEAYENKPKSNTIPATSRDVELRGDYDTADLAQHVAKVHGKISPYGASLHYGGREYLEKQHNRQHEGLHDLASIDRVVGDTPSPAHFHAEAPKKEYSDVPQIGHSMDTAGLKGHLADMGGHGFHMENEGRNTMEKIHNDEHHVGGIGVGGMGEPHSHNINAAQFNTAQHGNFYKSYPGTTQHGRVNRYGQQLDTYHEVRHPAPPKSFKPSSEAAKNADSFVY